MTPSETFDIVEVFFEEKQKEDTAAWKRIRWQTAWFVNMFVKTPLKETDLGIVFAGEIVKIDPEERRRQALKGAEFHARMAPKDIGRGKDGKPLIYGENN